MSKNSTPVTPISLKEIEALCKNPALREILKKPKLSKEDIKKIPQLMRDVLNDQEVSLFLELRGRIETSWILQKVDSITQTTPLIGVCPRDYNLDCFTANDDLNKEEFENLGKQNGAGHMNERCFDGGGIGFEQTNIQLKKNISKEDLEYFIKDTINNVANAQSSRFGNSNAGTVCVLLTNGASAQINLLINYPEQMAASTIVSGLLDKFQTQYFSNPHAPKMNSWSVWSAIKIDENDIIKNSVSYEEFLDSCINHGGFCGINILRNISPGNRNSDENGEPKEITQNGLEYFMISSQANKYTRLREIKERDEIVRTRDVEKLKEYFKLKYNIPEEDNLIIDNLFSFLLKENKKKIKKENEEVSGDEDEGGNE
jgi:hypothetical protein